MFFFNYARKSLALYWKRNSDVSLSSRKRNKKNLIKVRWMRGCIINREINGGGDEGPLMEIRDKLSFLLESHIRFARQSYFPSSIFVHRCMIWIPFNHSLCWATTIIFFFRQDKNTHSHTVCTLLHQVPYIFSNIDSYWIRITSVSYTHLTLPTIYSV